MTGDIFDKSIFFSAISMKLFFRFLQTFPALCRYWMQNEVKDRLTKDCVKRITETHFSLQILKQLFNKKVLNQEILKQQQLGIGNIRHKHHRSNDNKDGLSSDAADSQAAESLNNLQLKCDLRNRCIIAEYKDSNDIFLSMKANFPFDYPLQQLEFEWQEKCGFPNNKSTNQKLLLSGMVNSRNASISEAFCLWCINVSQHYQGIEECVICYCVVHPVKRTIPRIKCPTCKNKYHRYCIYRWTKTSGKNTCPMCRGLM